jgi:Flp pilus assembly pilin Flp
MGSNRSEGISAVIRRFVRDESGPTVTEYAVMLAVIMLGSVGVIGMLGQKFAVLYGIISAAMPDGFA